MIFFKRILQLSTSENISTFNIRKYLKQHVLMDYVEANTEYGIGQNAFFPSVKISWQNILRPLGDIPDSIILYNTVNTMSLIHTSCIVER